MFLDDSIERVMRGKYLLNNETADDMIYRVCSSVGRKDPAQAARWAKHIMDGYWMPSSPFLMNAGTKREMLSSCFVVDVPDDLGGIFDAVKEMALIQKYGGGTGMNFSRVREDGATVLGTSGVASGPVSFMEVFNAATGTIKQGGKRRGANIAILSIDHPDILEFVRLKRDLNAMQNFNVSVLVSDAFMRALHEHNPWYLRSRRDLPAIEIDPWYLWNEIATSAWLTGDPGILFDDHIQAANPTPWLGKLDGVNPCGEISLYAGEACNLASINLTKFVGGLLPDRLREDCQTPEELLDWSGFQVAAMLDVVRNMVRFLDAAIDVNEYPLESIRDRVRLTRKMGIGITGLHEALIAMGLPYGSQDARTVAGAIMHVITRTAYRESEELARELGPFPAWQPSDEFSRVPRRNATLTCIAPTGTISMILGVTSSGCEPLYSLSIHRNIQGEQHDLGTPKVVQQLIQDTCQNPPRVLEHIRETGTVADMDEVPAWVRNVLRTAPELTATEHLLMQAALQKYTDNNISKTINLPRTATALDIQEIYETAFSLGLHGVTVFRDGSRNGEHVLAGPLSTSVTDYNVCPVCGSEVLHEEGCVSCPQCGWSACSAG